MYTYTATAPLYKWGMPTGADAGQYSLLIGGLIVPLITSQAVTGKVTFLEKAGTGAANATGAYELDLTQIDDFSAAWRQMNRPTSDVFCSGGVTMPDKVGRQLNVGGWTGESNYGIRIYWPDGSAGVKGTNQWVEDTQNLQLQVPRWYPSAMMMANGSVLVMGGEIGQNAAEQPTLEILPPTGVPTTGTSSGYSNTTKYLDFLDRTAPFNLYPYMTVVPSGILVVYYNEARIIDEVNFDTIKTLPNLPGAVNDPTGGRSYQLQGAVVSLPQYAPFTDPLGVLACGGSTQNGGAAIDNCVSTYPEADNPTWTIERMVFTPLPFHVAKLKHLPAFPQSNALHGRSARRNLCNPRWRPTWRRRLRSRRSAQLQRSPLRPFPTSKSTHVHHGQHIRSTHVPL